VTRRHLLILSLLLAGFVAVSAATWMIASRTGIAALYRMAALRNDHMAVTLQSTLKRYESLPYLIGAQPLVQDALIAPDPARVEAANHYLEDVNQHVQAMTTYVIASNARCIAASNWHDASSFVGSDYGVRPYYVEAARGNVGRFFGIGTVSHDPGYYVSQPIRRDDAIIGVAVVKVDLNWFPGTDTAEPLFVTDEHGVIFLSSVPDWKYRTLRPLAPAVADAIGAVQQYERRPLVALPLKTERVLDLNSEIVRLGTGIGAPRYLETRRKISAPDWQLVTLSPLAPVEANARALTLLAGAGYVSLCLLAFYWRTRRARIREMMQSRALLQAAYAELNQRVEERTADLSAANLRLQREVTERTRTEQELRAAQDELIQASKLAALGQMAAGITHELNQPLTALRSFSDNSRVLLERGDQHAVRENLSAIALLTERMGRITNQLKLFVGRTRPARRQGSVAQALRNVLILLGARLAGVALTLEQSDGTSATPLDWHGELPEWYVQCEDLQLEQILINLIGNALDALASAAAPKLVLTVEARATIPQVLEIRVRDNGPGIAEEALPHVFEPFFTTKDMGQGMGLGLAIVSSIVRDCDGTLSAHNMPDGGACFVVALPSPSYPSAGG
jgi:two-component system, NtrC family, C4-dicarboxylate transport sensor histidine kinase DctB